MQRAPLRFGYRPAYRWVKDERGAYHKSRMPSTFSSAFSPVDLANPDFTTHPKARSATFFKCDLAAGDVLYMPPEYWHQVESKPGPEGISIALNFWQMPHLGFAPRRLMTPTRMLLRRLFSNVAVFKLKEYSVLALRRLGLVA